MLMVIEYNKGRHLLSYFENILTCYLSRPLIFDTFEEAKEKRSHS